MLEYYIVLLTLFTTGTFADGEIPLEKFDKAKYVMTNADNENYEKVLRDFGLTNEEIDIFQIAKENTIFILETPKKVGGEYITMWKNKEATEIEEKDKKIEVKELEQRFKLNDPQSDTFTEVPVTETFTVEDNKLTHVYDSKGEKKMTVTFDFTDKQLTETTEFNGGKATRLYKNTSEAKGSAAA